MVPLPKTLFTDNFHCSKLFLFSTFIQKERRFVLADLSPLVVDAVAVDGVGGNRRRQVFVGVRSLSVHPRAGRRRSSGTDPQVADHAVHFEAVGEILQGAVVEAVAYSQDFGVSEGAAALDDPVGRPEIFLQV